MSTSWPPIFLGNGWTTAGQNGVRTTVLGSFVTGSTPRAFNFSRLSWRLRVTSGLKLWLESPKFDSGRHQVGDSISSWKDLSPSKNDFSINIAAQPGVLAAGRNGNLLFTTNGVDQQLGTFVNVIADGDPFHVFFVCTANSPVTACARGEGGAGWSMSLGPQGGAIVAGGVQYTLPSYTTPDAEMASGIGQYSVSRSPVGDDTMNFYSSGYLRTSVATSSASLRNSGGQDMKIGISNTTYVQTSIGALLVYNRVLTARERGSVEAYLRYRWRLR